MQEFGERIEQQQQNLARLRAEAEGAGRAVATALLPESAFGNVAGERVAALQRERELTSQIRQEINQAAVRGEQQLNQDLINLAEARAQQRVSIAEGEARIKAALAGEEFDEEEFNRQAELFEARIKELQSLDQELARARERAASGGSRSLGIPAGEEEFARQIEAEIAQQRIVNANKLEAEQLFQEELLGLRQASNQALVALAEEQAREEVTAAFLARQAAAEEVGDLTPEQQAELEAEVQAAALESPAGLSWGSGRACTRARTRPWSWPRSGSASC